MYLVACKWKANGEISYKKPTDYLALSTATPDETEYAVAVLSLGAERVNIFSLLDYYWLEDVDGLNKITMTYYNDKNLFDLWNANTIHTEFLTNRSKFLNSTGITLTVVEKEVVNVDDSADYNTANQLFLNYL
jgi:hypothetical protein